MTMITKIAYGTRTTNFMNGFVRSCNCQVFRQPKEWSHLQRLRDAVWNIIDGYKPVVVKGVDKATGKKVALRDDKGRKLINWVRNIKKDNFVVTDTLNFNGTKIVTARDTNNGQVVAKEVSKSFHQGMDSFESTFENGKIKAMRQYHNMLTNKGIEAISEIFWYGRNNEGKLNKKEFSVIEPYGKEASNKFCAENCPELARGL